MFDTLAALGTLEKLIPVIEHIQVHIAPTVQAKLKNGEQLVGDIQNAISILKTAIDNIKAANGPVS